MRFFRVENGTLIEGDAISSEEEYLRLLGQGDKHYKSYLDATVRENTLDLALNEYARALEMEPESADLLSRMALIHFKKGNHGKCRQLTEKALLLQPYHKGSWYMTGYMAYKGGKPQECLESLRKAGFGSSKVHFTRAYAHKILAGQSKKPLQKLGHLFYTLCWMLTGLACYPAETNRIGFFHLLGILPGIIAAYYQDETGNTEKALEHYLKLCEHYPGVASLSNTVAHYYQKLDQPEESSYWLKKTLARHPGKEEALYQSAALLEEDDDYEEAIGIYEQLLVFRPRDPYIHCHLGNAYYILSQFSEAVTHYKMALSLGTDRAWRSLLAQSLGNIHHDHFNNPDAAIMAFEMARDLNPKDAENYIQLGLLNFNKEDYVNAELCYEQAIAIDAKNPRLYSNLGYLNWMRGNVDAAVRYYQLAIEVDPFYEIPYNNLGVIYLDSLGRIGEAIELFDKAISLNENYALAFYNLGRAYNFVGDRLEAATCYQVAQRLNVFTKELDNEELVARINGLFDPRLEEDYDPVPHMPCSDVG